MAKVRIQKLIADAGLGSRRAAESWILEGRVRVNGEVARLGSVADLSHDEVMVDGKPIGTTERHYLLLNKPAGYTSSLKDSHADHLVSELIPARWGRLFPVGRLDRDTKGLVIMTNDGPLAYRLMHPSFQVPKIYQAWVEGKPKASHLARLKNGVPLEEGTARAHNLQVIRHEGDRTLIRLTLKEGMKREVRRIFQIIGHPVLELTRVRYGPLTIEGLAEGEYRPLTHREVRELVTACTPREAQKDNSRRDGSRNESASRSRTNRSNHPGRSKFSAKRGGAQIGQPRRDTSRPHR